VGFKAEVFTGRMLFLSADKQRQSQSLRMCSFDDVCYCRQILISDFSMQYNVTYLCTILFLYRVF